ncbi:WD domain [Trypanosoma vivax]|nr:WD domain [Trypanosoma vivax]
MHADILTAPKPHTTRVMLRESFPRVPPELLLREQAGRYRLSGLGLLSLVEAITPRVNLLLPTFTQGGNNSVGKGMLANLRAVLTKKPNVPLDNIKRPSLFEQRLKQNEELINASDDVSVMSPTKLSGQRDHAQPRSSQQKIFAEVSPSQITVIQLVRRYLKARGGDKTEKDLHASTGTRILDDTVEEYEALWGYNTGAVMHVTLPRLSADLHLLRQAVDNPSWNDNKRVTFGERAKGDFFSAKMDDEGASSSESDYAGNCDGRVCLEDEGHSLGVRERAPSGVSLLGYHLMCSVQCLTYHAENDLAVSGGSDGTLMVWDLHLHYRAALRERRKKDDDTHNPRPTQQFAHHVHTRRLMQSIRRAHNGCVSALATHCELLLSGGVDGLIKVWICEVTRAFGSVGGLPHYSERQVFHCNGWVRCIWSSQERNVQGEDVLVACEDGSVMCLKSCTLSHNQQHASPQAKVGWDKQLLEALRNPRGALQTEGPKRDRSPYGAAGDASVSRPPSRALGRGGGGGDLSSKNSYAENMALKLLNSGFISRVLRVTRTLRTTSEEARIARSTASLSPDFCEATNCVMRIIPLIERNLYIIVGYSPLVRFLDMTRLKTTAVIEHPSLSALCGGGARNTAHVLHVQQKQRLLNKNGHKPVHSRIELPAVQRCWGSGSIPEALRFIDVLYVNVLDHLILLDNRNTVFVWDNTTNQLLATHSIPTVSEGGAKNNALHLLPCGTRYYGGSCQAEQLHTGVFGARSSERIFSQSLTGKEVPVDVPSTSGGRTEIERVPFFVVCTMGLEMYDIVTFPSAQINFKAHADSLVGIFYSPTSSHDLGACDAQASIALSNETCVLGSHLMGVRNEVAASDGHDTERVGIMASLSSLSEQEGYRKVVHRFASGNSSPRRIPGSVQLTESFKDDQCPQVISCSVDGNVRVWGDAFHPICSYNNEALKNEFAELTVNICRQQRHYDTEGSPHVSPSGENSRSNRTLSRGVSETNYETTSFYYSSRWNLAITGHDDGSIRYWHCDQQLAKCAWLKGLHSNAITGLVGARVARSARQREVLFYGGVAGSYDELRLLDVLATVSYDGCVGLWTGADMARAIPHLFTRVSNNELLCVAFDEVNQLFVVGDSCGTLSTLNASNLALQHSIPSQPPSPWMPRDLAMEVQSEKKSLFYDPSKNLVFPEKEKRTCHTEAITVLLVDGNFVFSGGDDGRLFMWDLVRDLLLREFILEDVEATDGPAKLIYESLHGGAHLLAQNHRGKLPTGQKSPNRGERRLEEESKGIVSILLLKQRDGDILVATHSGVIYRFSQNCSRPCYTYRHVFSIRCMCLLKEGLNLNSGETGNVVTRKKKDYWFELAVGGSNGNIAVVTEVSFSKLCS